MKKEIKIYEKMARLILEDEEREWAERIVERLEGEFQKLDSQGTEGVEPLVSVLEIGSRLREDIPKQYAYTNDLLENSPDKQNGYFKVPKTLE